MSDTLYGGRLRLQQSKSGYRFNVDAIALAIGVMSVLLVWRHSANIANLMAGRESRIGQKKA